ncbi:hypothetical protein ACI3ER_11600 [Bacillus sp. Wb]
MYFYTISQGEYSDYRYNTIYHTNLIPRKEFIEMYNYAVEKVEKKNEYVGKDDVAEFLCDHYGFNKVEDTLEINKDYGDLEKVTDKQDINGDHICISLEEKFD